IVTNGSLRLRTAVEYKTSDSEVFVLTKKLLSPPTFAGEPKIRHKRRKTFTNFLSRTPPKG
ncbi:MAG: hypothetical protein IJY44_07375, partial [Bacteroidaceae bacterium]|nr:hypothetical protein [Bacteroidaceae bacterium]